MELLSLLYEKVKTHKYVTALLCFSVCIYLMCQTISFAHEHGVYVKNIYYIVREEVDDFIGESKKDSGYTDILIDDQRDIDDEPEFTNSEGIDIPDDYRSLLLLSDEERIIDDAEAYDQLFKSAVEHRYNNLKGSAQEGLRLADVDESILGELDKASALEYQLTDFTLSPEEKFELYNSIADKRIYVYEMTNNSKVAELIAQMYLDCADMCRDNRERYEFSVEDICRLYRESIIYFETVIAHDDRESDLGDVLYRIGLCYDGLASVHELEYEDTKAFHQIAAIYFEKSSNYGKRAHGVYDFYYAAQSNMNIADLWGDKDYYHLREAERLFLKSLQETKSDSLQREIYSNLEIIYQLLLEHIDKYPEDSKYLKPEDEYRQLKRDAKKHL